METDAELIQRTLEGDKGGFANLIAKYQPQILALCKTRVKNPQDAEELAQDTFLCAYQKLERLRDAEKFSLWLKQIARNQCKMYWRRTIPDAVSLTDFPQLIDQEQTAEEKVVHRELLDATLQAIETLSTKDQQVLQAHLNGLSHAEISQRIAIPYRASRNRLYRTRQKIKAHVHRLLFSPSEQFSGGLTIMKVTKSESGKITIQFDSGYLSPHFVTNDERKEAVLESAYILIYDSSLHDECGAMVPILEQISNSDVPLVVIAENLQGDSLKVLEVNKIRGMLKVAAIHPPSEGNSESFLQDLATKTGGSVVANERDLRSLTLDDLGTAKQVVIDSDQTTIMP